MTEHLSSCAVHNEPAYPAGPCDCGAELRAEIERLRAALKPFADAAFNDNGYVTIDTSHIKTKHWLAAKKTIHG